MEHKTPRQMPELSLVTGADGEELSICSKGQVRCEKARNFSGPQDSPIDFPRLITLRISIVEESWHFSLNQPRAGHAGREEF